MASVGANGNIFDLQALGITGMLEHWYQYVRPLSSRVADGRLYWGFWDFLLLLLLDMLYI
jgi:hypothetical protein